MLSNDRLYKYSTKNEENKTKNEIIVDNTSKKPMTIRVSHHGVSKTSKNEASDFLKSLTPAEKNMNMSKGSSASIWRKCLEIKIVINHIFSKEGIRKIKTW